MALVSSTAQLQTITGTSCGVCGIAFGLEASFMKARLRDHRDFYYPNGCKISWRDKTADQQRIEQLESVLRNKEAALGSALRSRAWAEQQAKGANIAAGMAKGKLRRVIARVHAGVCPHCNRTFKQLAQHMKAKHPKAAA